jgi:hypothetical protein
MRQADIIYFDLNNAFYLVPHSLLLHKLSAFGLSGEYVNWFRSYPSNRKFQVHIFGILSSPSEVPFSVSRDLSWDPCSSMGLLRTYVLQVPTLNIYF